MRLEKDRSKHSQILAGEKLKNGGARPGIRTMLEGITRKIKCIVRKGRDIEGHGIISR